MTSDLRIPGPRGLDLAVEYRAGQELAPLSAQLAEAGIRLRLEPRPWSDLYPRLLQGRVGFYYGAWSCSSGDASDLFDNKIHTRDPSRGYGGSNSNGYSNPELDRLIESSGATLSMNERRRILESGMRMLDADLPLIPLVVPYDLLGLRREVEWAPRIDFRIRAANLWRAAG